MSRTFVSGFLVALALLVLPITVKAQILSYEAQVQALQQLIQTLLAQIAALQAQMSTGTNPSLGYSIIGKALDDGDRLAEGLDVDGLSLVISNSSMLDQQITFPTNCWHTYKMYDRTTNGVVFDLASIQQCGTAGNWPATTFKLRPGEQKNLDISHPESRFHLVPGSYTLVADVLSTTPVREAARFNFGVTQVTGGPSCSITTDKSSYAYGETIKLMWSSSNATSATWVPDTSGKDSLQLPSGTYAASGTTTLVANVSGNPPVTLRVSGLNGWSSTCTKVIPVSSPSTSSNPRILLQSMSAQVVADTYAEFKMNVQVTNFVDEDIYIPLTTAVTSPAGSSSAGAIFQIIDGAGAYITTNISSAFARISGGTLTSCGSIECLKISGGSSATLELKATYKPAAGSVQTYLLQLAFIGWRGYGSTTPPEKLTSVSDFRTRPVSIGAQSSAPSCTITASPSLVKKGGSTTVMWTSANATYTSLSTGSGGDKDPASGSRTFSNVEKDMTFELTAYGASDKVGKCSATVRVVPEWQDPVTPAAPCVLGSATVQSGQSRTFYSASFVAYGKTCATISLSRTCKNGTLSGSSNYKYAACKVAAPASCKLDGVTVAHGKSRRFYHSAATIKCGASSQARVCNNGKLSGDANYSRATCGQTSDAGAEEQAAAAFLAVQDLMADIESGIAEYLAGREE